ncbi:MAG: ABC transporter permease [Lysobacter sp.]|nr:ABC transporter permease [Lysobacter sp.]
MRKTWVFFKLRMMQLKYDKIGLFFSYVFPVLLLLGIGYPVQMASNQEIEVAYVSQELDPATRALISDLSKDDLVEFVPFEGNRAEAEQALKDNEIQHLLDPSVQTAPQQGKLLALRTNSLEENRIAALALTGILRGTGGATALVERVALRTVPVSERSSYVAVLLPGVIALTLLVIGLSGFGSVLIEEESQGLYKNLKTIDASPAAFLAGLFLSRLVVAYTVAMCMFGVSVLVLDTPFDVNWLLLMLAMTLGSMVFLTLGLLVFLFCKTVMAFNGVVSVIQLPLIMLGGVFFSITLFPEWMRPLATYSPMAPFTSALRDLMFGGVGFSNMSEIYPEFATMTVWLVLLLFLSKFKFRW